MSEIAAGAAVLGLVLLAGRRVWRQDRQLRDELARMLCSCACGRHVLTGPTVRADGVVHMTHRCYPELEEWR
jgi:hypothetical protein